MDLMYDCVSPSQSSLVRPGAQLSILPVLDCNLISWYHAECIQQSSLTGIWLGDDCTAKEAICTEHADQDHPYAAPVCFLT